jgi:single-stranded DNA-binding protein
MSIEAAFFGTLARDAEQKTSKAGKPYLRFTVSVKDRDQTQFVSVMYFGDDDAAPMVKGTRVYVEGSIRLDKWTASDGTERHALSCMSFFARVAAIGGNKPKRNPRAANLVAVAPQSRTNDLVDEVQF